jgi:hypothetical protein
MICLADNFYDITSLNLVLLILIIFVLFRGENIKTIIPSMLY